MKLRPMLLPLAGLVFWVGCDSNPTGPSAPVPPAASGPTPDANKPVAKKAVSGGGAVPASSLKD